MLEVSSHSERFFVVMEIIFRIVTLNAIKAHIFTARLRRLHADNCCYIIQNSIVHYNSVTTI